MLRLAFVIAFRLRYVADPRASLQPDSLGDYDTTVVLFSIVMITTFALRSLYLPRRGVSRVDLLYQVAGPIAIGWVFSLATSSLLFRSIDPPRSMLVYW